MHVIGFGRRAREAYPPTGGSAGAATAAMRNRNVAGATSLSAPFTPSSSSPIAAILFTPRVSGVLQVSASIAMTNGATGDTYEMVAVVLPGTGLSASGGEVTSDGWVMGSNTPPVVGGTPGAPVLAVADITSLTSGQDGALNVFGISTPPLPLGVPVIILVELIEVGGGHALNTITIANLSVMELP